MCVLALFTFLSCGDLLTSRDKNRPNIILVSIDTLRADHIHGYGYERETTPTLDDLMQRGTSFLNTISPSPWTLPAHVSLFTSLYPHTHGVTDHMLAVNERVPALGELLGRAGYTAGAFTTSPNLSPRHGFGWGFDAYVCKEERAPAVCERALAWLTQIQSKEFFLFLHFFDVHNDYTPLPHYLEMFESSYDGEIDGTGKILYEVRDGNMELSDEDVRHLIALYDGEIRQLDQTLGVFFGALEQKGLLSNTVIIITSDHGEEFMEHGGVLHGRTLYDELVKVPLILVGPTIPAGKLIETQAELIDIMPTILELCGVRIPSGLEGRSLLALISQSDADWPEIAFAEADHKNEVHDVKRIIRTDRYKLYYDRHTKQEELYDIVLDPGESNNILEQKPEVAEELRTKLRAWMATRKGNPTTFTLTDNEKERLRALGYLN